MLKQNRHTNNDKDYEPFILLDENLVEDDDPLGEEGEENNRFCDFCDCLLKHDKQKNVFCPMCGKQYGHLEKLRHGSKIITLADSAYTETFEQPSFKDEDEAEKKRRKLQDKELEEWLATNHGYIERSWNTVRGK